jgi:hypothetical protein
VIPYSDFEDAAEQRRQSHEDAAIQAAAIRAQRGLVAAIVSLGAIRLGSMSASEMTHEADRALREIEAIMADRA